MQFIYTYQKITLDCEISEDSIERFDRATGREFEEYFLTLESAEHKGVDISEILNEETIEDILEQFKAQHGAI